MRRSYSWARGCCSAPVGRRPGPHLSGGPMARMRRSDSWARSGTLSRPRGPWGAITSPWVKRGKRHRLGGPYHGTPPVLSRQVQGPPIGSILPWVSLIAPPLLPEQRASGLHSRPSWPWGFPIAGLCVSDVAVPRCLEAEQSGPADHLPPLQLRPPPRGVCPPFDLRAGWS